MQVKRTAEEVAHRIEGAVVIGIARLANAEAVVDSCLVAAAHGLTALEVPFTVAGAADAIRALRSKLGPGVLVGAGTVRSSRQVQEAVAAGAEFLVAPGLNLEVVRAARASGILLVPGVLSPTEVDSALTAGLRLLKLFPALPSGPEHLAALRQPFPEARFAPTGGVGPENAGAFLAAGAAALAMGSSIFPAQRIHDEGCAVIGPLVRAALDSLPKKP